MLRNFEVLGEAANHISQETKESYQQIEWYKLRGVRNFIIHEYFGIKLLTIWETAITDIPKLKEKLEMITAEIDDVNS